MEVSNLTPLTLYPGKISVLTASDAVMPWDLVDR
jgi:hypothetical protein